MSIRHEILNFPRQRVIVVVFDFLPPVLFPLVLFLALKKLAIDFIEKKLAPAVGIEPTTIVSYLVIKCHKVSYL